MKKSFVLYLDQYEPIKNLSNEQKGKLFDVMFLYNCGKEFSFDDSLVELAFSFFKQTFERDNAKYVKICEKNRENARIRWDAKNANACDRMPSDAKNADSDSDKIVIVTEDSDKKRNNKEKIPPQLKDVSDYCLERKNNIDPQNFIDHYEANGWKRGITKIKSWKACIRTWEKNSKPKQQEQTYATLNR